MKTISADEFQVIEAEKEAEEVTGTSSSAKGDAEEYKVYRQRFAVLAAVTLNYFIWGWSSRRNVIIVPAYAKFYNTTNEINLAKGELGLDSLLAYPSFVLAFSYIPMAYVIDRKGLRYLLLGSLAVCIHTWLWYLNDAGAFGPPGVLVPLLSKILTAVFGPLISTATLALSNRWFPPRERATATATIALAQVMASVLATIIAPLFETTDPYIDLSLKSCQASAATVSAFNAALANNTLAICNGNQNSDAIEEFCCAAEADVATYALYLAIGSTIITVFSFGVIKDYPPTPPSASSELSSLPRFTLAIRHIVQYKNYLWFMLGDILVSGPPLVAAGSIARILPGEVAEYVTLAAAMGIALAIPGTFFTAVYLIGRRKLLWETTSYGFAIGTLAWILATIGFAVDTAAGAYLVVVTTVVALAVFTSIVAAEMETKLEYIFTPDFHIEGLMIGIDRVVTHILQFVSLSTYAPEL